MSRLCVFFACLLLLSFAPTWGQTEEQQESLYDAKTGIAAFTTGLELQASRNAQLGLLGTLFDGNKMNNVRGDIGEYVAERFLNRNIQPKRTWVSVAPRLGRQGIDHIYVRIRQDGLPSALIVGETKFGNSELGFTKDGIQMGSRWRAKRLLALGQRYYDMAQAPSVIRKVTMPINARSTLTIYVSKTRAINFWKEDKLWCTDAPADIDDTLLKKRAKTYGDFFQGAGRGTIVSRNRLLRVVPQTNGDYLVSISEVVDQADGSIKLGKADSLSLPSEYIRPGKASLKALQELIKKQYPMWSDEQVRAEAKQLKKVISSKELIEDAGRAGKLAFRESMRSVWRGASFASGMTFIFMIGQEMITHGLDWSAYNWGGVGKETLGSAAVFGAANGLGAATTYAFSSGVTRNALNAVARNATTKGGALVAKSLLRWSRRQCRLNRCLALGVFYG